MSVTQLFSNSALLLTAPVPHKIHVPCLPCFSDDRARKVPQESAVLEKFEIEEVLANNKVRM